MSGSGIYSNGPDPKRANPACRDYHDMQGRIPGRDESSGTSWELGGAHYNCCCCASCWFLRPHDFPGGGGFGIREYCCRCVPRMLMLVFTPTDDENECCKSIGKGMIHQKGDESQESIYSATLFGVDVEVRVGRVIGSSGAYDDCGWSVSVDAGAGYGSYQEFPIDHDEINCLSIPDGIELGSVEGQDGCMGTLSLVDVSKARLPFEKRVDTADQDGGNFQNLTDNPWGPFTQVCSRICANGYRHPPTGEPNRRDFVWFDNSEYGASYDYDEEYRGWSYANPVTDKIEYIYAIMDESGNAVLKPDLEDGAEKYDPITLDSDDSASCKLRQVFSVEISGTGYTLEIRCGTCTCWHFHCATCRCVPAELCIIYYDGDWHTNVHAYWNSSTGSWDADDEEHPISLVLRENDAEQCIIVPAIDGVDVSMEEYPVYDCGEETVTGQFTGKHDVVSVTGHGTIESDSGSGTDFFFFNANSLMPSCIPSPCPATLCHDECGGDPATLTLTIDEWNEEGDHSGPPGYAVCSCTTEITLQRVETFFDFTDEGPQFSCGYIGFYSISGGNCDGCVVQAVVQATELSLGLVDLECDDPYTALNRTTATFSAANCDPYYAQSPEYGPDSAAAFFASACMVCDYYPFRSQFTLSE